MRNCDAFRVLSKSAICDAVMFHCSMRKRCPGIIRTEMTAQVAGRYDRLIAEGRVPARRWGERADVASVAVALAGGAFGFASGTVVNVDGGLAIPRL